MLAAFAPDLSHTVGPAAIQNLRVPSARFDAYGGESMRTERLKSGATDPRRELATPSRRTEIFPLPVVT